MFVLLCVSLLIMAAGVSVYGNAEGWSFGTTLAVILAMDLLVFGVYAVTSA
jgi:hypothetical protein